VSDRELELGDVAYRFPAILRVRYNRHAVSVTRVQNVQNFRKRIQ